MKKSLQTVFFGFAAAFLPWAVGDVAAHEPDDPMNPYSAAQLVFVDKVSQDLLKATDAKAQIAEKCGFPVTQDSDIVITDENAINASNGTDVILANPYEVDWFVDPDGSIAVTFKSVMSQVYGSGISAVIAYAGKSEANLYCRGHGQTQHQHGIEGPGNKTPTQLGLVFHRGPCNAVSESQVDERFAAANGADTVQGYRQDSMEVDICGKPPELTKWCSYNLPDGDILKCETYAEAQQGQSVIYGNSKGFSSGGSNVIASCECQDLDNGGACGTFDPNSPGAFFDFCVSQ